MIADCDESGMGDWELAHLSQEHISIGLCGALSGRWLEQLGWHLWHKRLTSQEVGNGAAEDRLGGSVPVAPCQIEAVAAHRPGELAPHGDVESRAPLLRVEPQHLHCVLVLAAMAARYHNHLYHVVWGGGGDEKTGFAASLFFLTVMTKPTCSVNRAHSVHAPGLW